MDLRGIDPEAQGASQARHVSERCGVSTNAAPMRRKESHITKANGKLGVTYNMIDNTLSRRSKRASGKRLD